LTGNKGKGGRDGGSGLLNGPKNQQLFPTKPMQGHGGKMIVGGKLTGHNNIFNQKQLLMGH
jgi:hypothetical protein